MTQRYRRFEKDNIAGRALPQRLDVIEHPESPAVRSCDEVVFVQREIADRRRRQVEAQRLPAIAVVEGDVDGLLAAGEKKTALLRIFSNDVDDSARRNPADDLGPTFPAVARAKDVRAEIVEAECVDRGVRG